MTNSVFIAVPHYNQLAPQALAGLMLATQNCHYSINLECGSLLSFVFNRLWCKALNQRTAGIAKTATPLTHFAMHHSDISAPPGWVDVLVAEMARVGADVISTVIPIKDQRGLTSTGLMNPETKRIQRLTMKEALALPATFSAKDTEHPSHHLMVNTGLWLCDFTKPWVEEVFFTIVDGMLKEEGKFIARVLSEDWNFSKWCAEHNLKVFATTAVKTGHHGNAEYRNDTEWGSWETDKGDSAA